MAKKTIKPEIAFRMKEVAEQEAKREALGLRAVACKGWKWKEGMLALSHNKERRILEVTDGEPYWDGNGYRYRLIDGFPDLTDPATVGCLLALVREAWGAGVHLVPDGGWLVRGARLPERNDPGVCHPGATVNLGICEPTEAAALVAALEAVAALEDDNES